MKLAHTIVVSLFSKEEQDHERMKGVLKDFFPFSLEEEKIKIDESSAAGMTGSRIRMLEVKLEKERHTTAFLQDLAGRLSGAQRQQIVEQENRVDDSCQFFLRFQKDALPDLVLTDGGDCLHVRVALAAFPKKREVALGLVKEIFK